MVKPSESKEDDDVDMYLNPRLVYKVADLSGKEKPCPYFKSNQPKTVPKIGQSQYSKKLIMGYHVLSKERVQSS